MRMKREAGQAEAERGGTIAAVQVMLNHMRRLVACPS